MTMTSDFQTRINRINASSMRTGIPADMARHRSSHALMNKMRKAARRDRRPGVCARTLGVMMSPCMMVAVVWLAVGDDVQRTISSDLRAPAYVAALPQQMMDRLHASDLELSDLLNTGRLVRTYASLTD